MNIITPFYDYKTSSCYFNELSNGDVFKMNNDYFMKIEFDSYWNCVHLSNGNVFIIPNDLYIEKVLCNLVVKDWSMNR